MNIRQDQSDRNLIEERASGISKPLQRPRRGLTGKIGRIILNPGILLIKFKQVFVLIKEHFHEKRDILKNTFLIYLKRAPSLQGLQIEINSACNRTCDWCPNGTNVRPDDQFLDEELFYKIIDEAKEIKFNGSITFNGYNEPLIDKRILKFIKYIRENLPSSYIYLSTNGDYLNLELWKNLRREGLDFANISQYDGKINKNVQRIMEQIEPEEKKLFDAKVFNKEIILNRAGLIKTKTELPLNKYCNRPFFQMTIDYQGKVNLCCNDYFSQVEMGDVRTQSLNEIWQSDVFVSYRKQLLKGNRADLELCNACDMPALSYVPGTFTPGTKIYKRR